MRKLLILGTLWIFVAPVIGQTAVPDTIYIYETIMVYDTMIIRDTIRIKKAMNMPVVQAKNIVVNNFVPPAENIIYPPDTFSENRIILHESKSNHKQKNVKTMKLDVVNYLNAIILTAQTMSGISAQETKPAENMPTFPIQMSFVYPMTTQGAQTVNYRYHLSFNMLIGKVGAVKGVEFGGLFNQAERDVKGIQFGGLANRSQEITGVQFGGLGNAAKTVKGIQFGGLANISESNTGIQFGGITNISDRVWGIQFGGIANICKEATGVQFAGITNISKEVSGTSFGGVYNRTGTLRGFQFGVVNVIDTIESGVSMAIVNIVKKGFYNEWALSFADYQNVGLSYKMGTQKFYTIFTAGANFMKDNLWVFGIGFGNRTVLNRHFDFQPEIISYQYFPSNFKNIQNTSATYLKFGFVYKFNEKLGIVVAPSIYHFNSDLKDNGQAYRTSPLKELYSKVYNKNNYNSFGMGMSIGIVMNCHIRKNNTKNI